jgi:hypothetical protein
MRTEVYSWRVSGELKSVLERAARMKKVRASAILDIAVRELLLTTRTESGNPEVQRMLHAEAVNCLGVLAGRNPRWAETARKTIRKRLARRRAR